MNDVPAIVAATVRPAGAGDPFVMRIRSRAGVLRLDGEGSRITLRVALAELWDTFAYDVPSALPVIALKRDVLARFGPTAATPADYVLKLHGAEVRSEQETVAASGARDGSTFFLALRRRRPVR